MARTDVNVRRETNPSTHDDEKRSRKFRGPLFVGLLVVPAFGLLLRFIIFWAPEMLWLVAGLSLTTGFIYASAAVAIGYKVSKRVPLVIWHVAATGFLFGGALYITTVVRWPAETAPWYHRLLAVVNWPAWWVIVHLFGAIIVGGSWLLYRIDAFRAATGADEFSGSGLDKLLKVPLGMKVRDNTITADEFAIEAEIAHPGIPVAQVQGVLQPLVEQAGAIRGRSTIVPGDVGGKSQLRLVMKDPLDEWKTFPGLSHPGESFAYPIRTAYYVAGKNGQPLPQWYSFAQTPNSSVLRPSRLAPNFSAPNDASFGRQGATRAGKSGDNAIEIAEVASRCDAGLFLVNTAKLLQDIGWALDFAVAAADTKPKASVLFEAVRRIGEYRSNQMGHPKWQGRHRTWSPLTYAELGFMAIVVEVDEGDQVLNSATATWLATKGLSLGIFLSVMISRAATDGMASTLRSAVTQWKAFGAGQAYDGGFVLSDETIAAGADVGSLSTRFPGSHYLDKAQGVDETMYPQLARSYKTERDFSDLRRAVEAARAAFTPPVLTPGEIEAAGGAETLRMLSPQTLLAAFDQEDTGPAPAGTVTSTERTTVETAILSTAGDRPDDTGDLEVDALLAKPRADLSDLEKEYGPLPAPGESLPDRSNPDLPSLELASGDDRPSVSPDELTGEANAALIRMAQRGVTRFGNKELMDEMRVDPTPTQMSRWLKGLCDDGKHVAPPGVTVEREPGRQGRYVLVWLAAEGV
jgi:hypothetical protein